KIKNHYHIKIGHTINLPKTKLLAINIEEMVLPSPVFRIDSTDYVGDENFIIELSLDKKTPIKLVSYTPISGEKAVFDKEKKKLEITIPPILIEKNYFVKLGQLKIEMARNWEGFLPLKGAINRNHWQKKIDLSKSVEIGRIDINLERPAIVHPHPQFLRVNNYSRLNIIIGSHVLVKKDDEFIVALSEPMNARFKVGKISNPLSNDYKLKVINKNTCKIILTGNPLPGAKIVVKELPFQVSNVKASSNITIKYPRALRSDDIILSSAVIVPEIDTLRYHSSNTITLPAVSLFDMPKGIPSYAYVLSNDGKEKNLLDNIKSGKSFSVPRLNFPLKNVKKNIHVDYFFKYGKAYVAKRKVIINGKIEINYASS
ncbi:uncharacterized protein METZ01_LOCUS310248, partial [marine metagenome]